MMIVMQIRQKNLGVVRVVVKVAAKGCSKIDTFASCNHTIKITY